MDLAFLTLMLQAGGTLVGAAVAWGALRAEQKATRERLTALENRFNNHIEKGLIHGNAQA